jgi:hypothetical protein
LYEYDGGGPENGKQGSGHKSDIKNRVVGFFKGITGNNDKSREEEIN